MDRRLTARRPRLIPVRPRWQSPPRHRDACAGNDTRALGRIRHYPRITQFGDRPKRKLADQLSGKVASFRAVELGDDAEEAAEADAPEEADQPAP